MNILKKLTALLLSLGILISSAAGVFAAENFDDDGNRDQETGLAEGESDVIIEETHPQHELDNPDDAYMEELEYSEYIRGRNEYNETVKKLTSFDMWEPIEGGSYLEYIKAGEYFLSVCRYINLPYNSNEDLSSEVAWEEAYKTLKNLGYVDFDIDVSGKISFEQALRVLVNALGYKQFASLSGSDTSAYVRIASEHDITKKFPQDLSSAMTRTAAANLIDDSTEAEAYIYKAKNDYEYVDALMYYKHIRKVTGIAQAVSESSITDGVSASGGILINDNFLISDRKDLYDYLACKVEAYYNDEAYGDKTLLYITYHKSNKIMTIEGCDIEGFESRRLSYFVSDENKKSVVIDQKATEILNGFSPRAVKWEDIDNCDYVKLVDNDNNGRYDVVFVYKYDIMVVERVSESTKTIYGLYNDNENGSLKVDFDSPNLEMTDRVGNPVESYYITKDSVLSVAKDPDTGKMKIIVSNLMYTGTVKGTNSGETYYESTVDFGDRTYTYSTNFRYYKGAKEIKTGDKYNVYLDYRGRIAGYDLIKEDELKYGFLIKAWMNTDTGEEELYVKMLPYSGDMADFKLIRKVCIDGYTAKNETGAISNLKTASQGVSAVRSEMDSSYIPMDYDSEAVVYLRVPVMYKQNSKGEITYIDTPYHSEKENIANDDVFHDNTMTMYEDFSKRASDKRPGGMYLRNTLAFNSDNGNNVALNNNTKVFVVPVSNEPWVVSDNAQYQKTNLAYFDDWNYYPKTGDQYTVENRLEAYNVDEARVAGVLVYYTSDVVPEIDKKVPLTVVDEIIEALNDDGEVVKRLIGWQGNSQIKIDIAEGVVFTRYYNGADGEKIKSTVKHGDIIRYVTNNKGELANYVKVFSLKDEDDPDYVKTGNEYGTAVNPLSLNKTMLAVSDGRYKSNGHNSPHVYTSLGNYNYGATYRLVYGTLLYRNGRNLVLKTTVDTALGQLERTEIADFSGYNVLCIDEERDEIYVPTEDELLAQQGAGDDASKVILHTEGGKQRQLIIIKRAE